MPPASIKLIWSISACNFCPRTGVRTCQIKPGKLLSKLSMALEIDLATLDNSEGICTCCLADVDMIIRAVAIRGAMKDYYTDFIQSSRHRYNNNTLEPGHYTNGHYVDVMGHNDIRGPMMENNLDYENRENRAADLQDHGHPPPPLLVARPSVNRESVPLPLPPPRQFHVKEESPEPSRDTQSTPTPTKKTKERHTRYQCILCDKIAGSKSHCMEHLICHSPVRPFTCSHCMKTYKSRKACREHLIVMHGVEKVEENLQKLVLVDTEGLKQLENVCTQFRRIYTPPAIKPSEDLSIPGNSVMLQPTKSEPDDLKSEQDGGSAWLYAPASNDSAGNQIPPPLLQCRPNSGVTGYPFKPTEYEQITPPPSKRTRKGTPHKLVHGTPTDVLDLERIAKSMEDSGDEGSLCESMQLINGKPFEFGTSMRVKEDWSHPVLSPDSNHFHSSTSAPPTSQQVFSSFAANEIPPVATSNNRQSPNQVHKKMVPPCERCGRCFPTKEKMADHMRSHSEVKQFSCLVCNRFFKYRRGVTNHLKEVHHLTDRNEISSKVASHEVGVVVPSKAARARERKAMLGPHTSGAKQDQDGGISQKVIQDTLSSLADIQSAADSATMPAAFSDDSNNEEGSVDNSGYNEPNADGKSVSPSVASAEYDHAGADEVFNPEDEDDDDMESINLELPKETAAVTITAA